ncbi:carboxymuconolactone decarboxylase family protein [Kushneria aurantia]|uniref:Carboxymuconolactone decarboxylase family protein n=1 Tax=Kushneria aurantia TaxID=504092 RepID=A0ABV6G0H8_9GAMM|nr:carboxymuconolactone decarboxylase family protein [Kushneria aurantia]
MRMDYRNAAPGAIKAIRRLDDYLVAQCDTEQGIEPSLMELIRIRASQLNRCAFCVDLHSRDARRQGETEQRLYALCVWRETPFFTPRERAALAWTEANTLLSEGVETTLFDEMRRHFSEPQLVNLTLAVATINAWNRFGVSFAPVPGYDRGS